VIAVVARDCRDGHDVIRAVSNAMPDGDEIPCTQRATSHTLIGKSASSYTPLGSLVRNQGFLRCAANAPRSRGFLKCFSLLLCCAASASA
jgi:hypothetical protein